MAALWTYQQPSWMSRSNISQIDEYRDPEGETTGAPTTEMYDLCPSMDFDPEIHSHHQWRTLLHLKGIYSLEFPAPSIRAIFGAFQSWMDESKSDETRWDVWTEPEIEVLLMMIERLSFALKGFNEEQRICESWSDELVCRTGVLPSSLHLQGVRRVSEHPFACGGLADMHAGIFESMEVAIKTLRFIPRDPVHNELHKEIVHEIFNWRDLDHPNLLPFLGVTYDTSPGRISLVSPLMRNGNIIQYINDDPTASKLTLFRQCALGLSYLHSHDPVILHGDINARNILIDEEGNARLCDFGYFAISKIRGFLTSSDLYDSRGSMQFIAPELFALGAEKTCASDVYALGMTIFEVCTGQLPFGGKNSIQVLMAVMGGIRPTRDDIHSGISDDLWALIERCWHQDPRTRPSVNAVADELGAQEHQTRDDCIFATTYFPPQV